MKDAGKMQRREYTTWHAQQHDDIVLLSTKCVRLYRDFKLLTCIEYYRVNCKCILTGAHKHQQYAQFSVIHLWCHLYIYIFRLLNQFCNIYPAIDPIICYILLFLQWFIMHIAYHPENRLIIKFIKCHSAYASYSWTKKSLTRIRS